MMPARHLCCQDDDALKPMRDSMLRRRISRRITGVGPITSRALGGTARLVLLVAVAASAACASAGGVPRPFPGAARPPTSPSPPTARTDPEPDAIPPAVVVTALTLRGTQYRNGGSEPSRGFDCSGLVQWVFAQHGTALPREVRGQYDAGRKIDEDEVQPGDLVFFQTISRGPSHVGIALGGGEFVHAPSSRGVVRVERYTSGYWSERWIGARRVD
jgi:cell wall-associated NlpC family hydrolase